MTTTDQQFITVVRYEVREKGPRGQEREVSYLLKVHETYASAERHWERLERKNPGEHFIRAVDYTIAA